MNSTFRVLAAVAFGTALSGTPASFGLAQGVPSAPASGGAAASYGDAGPGSAGELTAPPDATQATELPVLYVTGVEVMRTATEPRLDIVRVVGLASSQGWSAPQLVPTYAGKSFDDILDLQLIAIPPDQSQTATGFFPVAAIFPLEPDRQFKGVRVRASENAVTVRQIPGSSQASVDVNDCKDCMGKTLASGDQAQPGQDVVRQDQLPKSLRVIHETDGIRGAEQDPNRLTLILDDKGVIEEAYWE